MIDPRLEKWRSRAIELHAKADNMDDKTVARTLHEAAKRWEELADFVEGQTPPKI